MIRERPGFADLAGRTVLVTGGATGIGAAVARGFADCGATVAVHYNGSRDAAEELVAHIVEDGGRAFTVQADLSRPEAAGNAIDAVLAETGRLDVLVNNAGTTFARKPTAEMDDEHFRRILDLNFMATFAACRAVVPVFRRQGGGTIVNTTSIAARFGGSSGTVVYAASKAAVSTFTRGLARELAPEGIRVNAVAPGVIATALHEQYTPATVLAGFASTIPMGRIGDPDDVVGAYLFLASDRLSKYITGQVIEVNGGMTMP